MKKKFWKIILSLLLAMITVLSAFAMFGCKGNDAGKLPDSNNTITPAPKPSGTTETSTDTTEVTADTTADTETAEQTSETLEDEETTEEETTIAWGGGELDSDITLFDGSNTDFTIVIAKKASSVVSGAAADLKSALSSKKGVSLEVKNEDFFKLLNGGTLEGHKIVVGSLVGEKETQETELSLRDDGYIIRVVNGSLYIIGGSDEATKAGVSYFIDKYLKGNEKTLTLEKGLVYEKYTTASVRSMKIAGNEIWRYSIVYHDDTVTKKYADEIQGMIFSATGYTLPMKGDSTQATEFEILVGDTNRKETLNVKSDYDRPSVYYDVKVSGKKLVILGEGWFTLKEINAQLKTYFSKMTNANSNITGEVFSGNVKSKVDNSGMLDRASGTSLRVFNFNVYGVTYEYETYKMFASDEERGEVMADVALMYYPDVITTNELFKGHPEYKTFMAHLSKYYTLLSTSEYDKGTPAGVTDPTTTLYYCGVPVQIFLKKSCNFKVVDSGWRYISDTIEPGRPEQNPWHGIHWAVLKNSAGKSFIVSVAHYGDGRTSDTFAREHYAAIQTAQAASGSSSTLPTIAAGDFFSKPSEACYKYLVNNCGFSDAQQKAPTNCNGTKTQATCHPLAETRTSGVIYDFILYKGFTPLKFKVLKNSELEYASDHYPVCADFKL